MKRLLFVLILMLVIPCSIAFADAISFSMGLDFFSGLMYHRNVWFSMGEYIFGGVIALTLTVLIQIVLNIIMKKRKVDKKVRKKVLIILALIFIGFEVFAFCRGLIIVENRPPEPLGRFDIRAIDAYNSRFIKYTGGESKSRSLVMELIEECRAHNANFDPNSVYGAISVVLKEFKSDDATNRPVTKVRTEKVKTSKEASVVDINEIKNTSRYYIDISAYNRFGAVSEITIYKVIR